MDGILLGELRVCGLPFVIASDFSFVAYCSLLVFFSSFFPFFLCPFVERCVVFCWVGGGVLSV
jgi:hypothetical protein